MRPWIVLMAVALCSITLSGLYLTYSGPQADNTELPAQGKPLEKEAGSQAALPEKAPGEEWTGGSVREFSFNCSPGKRIMFTLVSVREGSDRQITSTGQATAGNPAASLPSKCFFSPEFECTDHSFRPGSFWLRLKNMAMSKVEVVSFTMKNESGFECQAG